MRAAFVTLGCKVNQYETQLLSQQFLSGGFVVVGEQDEADVYVINSCTVTSSGDKKTRQLLRRLRRSHPQAVIALTGCYPQAFPQETAALLEADVVTGSSCRARVLPLVQEFLQDRRRRVEILPHPKGEAFEPMQVSRFRERTRAFVKIQDGCERYCSYCIIPIARGPVRSKPLPELRQELLRLKEAGYQEVVLVGINLSTYGKDLGLRLTDAVSLACQECGIPRVRLGSLEPDLLSWEDIRLLSQLPGFCPQFHLSLQSGCDATLKRMNRHYDAALYRQVVQEIRRVFPHPAITTDVMTGFAGETEADAALSEAFVREIGFAKVHVFPYSVREGTRAAKMPNQVPSAVKEERSHRMAAVAAETRKAFLQSQVGLRQEVLFETKAPAGGYLGYTPNYTPVLVPSLSDLRGQRHLVRILSSSDDQCEGALEL